MGSEDKALQTASTPTPNEPACDLSARYVARVWERMGAIYGQRWASSFGESPQGIAAETWARGLASLTGEQLARGLAACANCAKGYVPSLPEFRARCLGIPDFGVVLRMLRPGSVEVSPFVRLCWRYLDPYALRQADARTERAMMREAYDVAAQFVMDGGELPGEEKRITHDDSAESELYARIHFKRMRDLLSRDETTTRKDASP